jgi:hypothetical protein
MPFVPIRTDSEELNYETRKSGGLEHLPKKVSGYHILYLYYLACCGVKLVVAQRLPGA